jgi:carbon-monoxide dehydrogenase iron sulfur subunit
MGVLEYSAELCVGCTICEEVCSETWFKVTDAGKSSIRIRNGGQPAQLQAIFCVQCGDCVEVCPTQALARDKRGVVRLQKKLCVGCLTCVGFCPYAAMFHHPDQDEPFKCVACGRCVQECPAEALSIADRTTD